MHKTKQIKGRVVSIDESEGYPIIEVVFNKNQANDVNNLESSNVTIKKVE